ncbi:30S ribosomal protein S4 [bacterium]|nr:30S ribosomal protein S4 [bacterium]MBU3956241.1 30S ribosomal protein S4 [bacterium]
MSRYTGPKCKLCKKYGEKLYLKGDRCWTAEKCPMARESTSGGGVKTFRRQKSEYAKHLKEKQKSRILFGVGEAQLRKVFHTISRKKGIKGENLLSALSRRLDNVVYRLNMAASLPQARQIVGHRFMKVNGRVCNIPSRELGTGDKIALTEKGKKIESVKKSLEHSASKNIPDWLKLEKDMMTGTVARDITSEDLVQAGIDHRLIVEFYSR